MTPHNRVYSDHQPTPWPSVRLILFPWVDHELSEGTGFTLSMPGSRPSQDTWCICLIPQAHNWQSSQTLPLLQAWCHRSVPLLTITWNSQSPISMRPSQVPSSLWVLLWLFCRKKKQNNNYNSHNPHFLQSHLELFLSHTHGSFHKTASVPSAGDNGDTVIILDSETTGNMETLCHWDQTDQIWGGLCKTIADWPLPSDVTSGWNGTILPTSHAVHSFILQIPRSALFASPRSRHWALSSKQTRPDPWSYSNGV